MKAPMDPVRFGVIGSNRGNSFIKVCAAVSGATVTSIYDIALPSAERIASQVGAQAFDDLEAFLASDIDAVTVASPLPFHAEQASAALRRGKHVLSEVTACITMEQARELLAAQRAGGAVYMMAENYRYLDEIELLKRMHDAGRFGKLYYGEGEYLHDCQGLWYDDRGHLTWRGQGGADVYGTHSLGPLLYITGERVAQVSALAVPGGLYDAQVTIPTMHILQLVTDGGLVFRVRVDHVSRRPHQMAYYALQGTGGSYEAWRGFGDQSKIWLEDEHEPSLFHAPARWHALSEQAERYIPERLAAPPEARSGGHGTSEYWLMQDFIAAVRGECAAPIDVYRALDYTLPCICAAESAAAGGTPIAVPDPRSW